MARSWLPLLCLAVQFKAVCDGVRAESARIVIEGDEVSLDPTCGAYITMNPGYLGRSELPEGKYHGDSSIRFALAVVRWYLRWKHLESSRVSCTCCIVYRAFKDWLYCGNEPC